MRFCRSIVRCATIALVGILTIAVLGGVCSSCDSGLYPLFRLVAVAQAIPARPEIADAHQDGPLDPSPPSSITKLVFIHHSVGNNWLENGNGDLGRVLGENNYYVSDTGYDWGPDSIGSYTDIGHWWRWFRGENSSTYLNALYNTTDQIAYYTRDLSDPGGENEIILFKPCYPNSNLRGQPDDPPVSGDNPLRGQAYYSEYHTVGHAKGIYNDILEYLRTRQDKLFVVITAPPVQDETYAANARALNDWLVNEWLADYPYHNVAVFDLYNVLTTNGGGPDINDLGWASGNHHRLAWTPLQIEHLNHGDDDASPNILEYPTGDDHPSRAGNQKATGELVPLLNVYYNCWKSGDCTPASPKALLYLPIFVR